MRITITPTGDSRVYYPTASVEVPHDDIAMPEVVRMLRGLLVVAGFHPDTVNEYIPDPE